MKDVHRALGFSLNEVSGASKIELFFDPLAADIEVSGASKIELFFDPLAADITASGLKMKRVARHACMEPVSTASRGPSFTSIRVSARKYSLQAAHRVQATGFSAPHGDLEDGTSWRIAGIHRLSKKGGVEKLNRFAYILPRQLVQDEPRGPRQRTVSIRAWESHGFLPYGHSSGVTGMSRPGRPPFFCPS